MFDTQSLQFSPARAEIFSAPITCLPTPLPSDNLFGTAQTTTLAKGTPIHAMIGDSHAALYGHGVRRPGTAYALEGNITVSAQAAAFMAQMLGLNSPAALSDLAQTVPDSGGVSFVPALVGLGAPHWNDHATTPAHLARATFEAIALQVADVFTAMEADSADPLQEILADGGASSNDFLILLQADILTRPVQRAAVEEIGALGVAAMAFAAMGHPMTPIQTQPTRFTPQTHPANLLKTWQNALAKACL